ASPWRTGRVSERRCAATSRCWSEEFIRVGETCRVVATLAVLREYVSLEWGEGLRASPLTNVHACYVRCVKGTPPPTESWSKPSVSQGVCREKVMDRTERISKLSRRRALEFGTLCDAIPSNSVRS